MNWVIFVLAGAVFNSLKNVATRKVGSKVDVYTVAVVSTALMLPVLWTNVWLNNTSTIEPEFWRQMALMLPFEILAMFLFFKALTSSKLSYSFPFVSFMPVFVAIGSFFILDERVSTLVYAGALTIVTGAFLMNLKKDTAKSDINGVLYMLTVAALWGYIIPMGSLAITYSSAQLYPAIYFSLATLLFLPIFFFKRSTKLTVVLKNVLPFLFIGLFYALFTASNWYAYSIGPATAISALTMMAIPLTSLFSGVYYKESLGLQKSLATAVMTIGAILAIVG